MMSKAIQQGKQTRSERWAESLRELARGRGDSEALAARAVLLCRQLNVSPWIALAVVERRVSLKEARLLDRVGQCKELQPAILDKHRSLDELKVLLPYAAYFLAADLQEACPARKWDSRLLVRILEGVLGDERQTGGESVSLRVRGRSLAEYESAVESVLAIMKRARCDAGMALDVRAGRVSEQFALDYGRQRRTLELEERRLHEPAPPDRPRFPARRGESAPAPRPVFSRPEHPRPAPFPARDHWPR